MGQTPQNDIGICT